MTSVRLCPILFTACRKSGGHAFFFFFLPAGSPHYDDPRFIAFCNACAATRSAHPSMTTSLLRTTLAIAASGKAEVSYTDLAEQTGLSYDAIVYQVAQLALGRGGQPGLGLVSFPFREGGRTRGVALSEAGVTLVERFIDPADRGNRSIRQIARHLDGPYGALSLAADELEGLSLGSLVVLLHAARFQQKFAYEGLAARALGEALAINNLPRHLALLGDGLGKRAGYGLITLVPHGTDSRKKLPELTDRAHDLLSRMAATVVGEPVSPPLRPKAEVIATLDAPVDVEKLGPEHFEPIKQAAPDSRGRSQMKSSGPRKPS